MKWIEEIFKYWEEAISRYGCGMAGIPYPDDLD